MPIKNGEYEKLTADEIQERLENELRKKLGVDAQPGDLITSQLEAEAQTLAENQEEALKRVYESAYLEDANGEELDKLVSIINIERREATSATGSATFSRETPAKSNYTIPRGITIQTRGSGQVKFETTQTGSLAPVDDFEANNFNNWTKDVGEFSITDTETLSGSYSLEIPAILDSEIKSDDEFTPGSRFTFEYKTKTGSITAFRFAVQDNSNYYEAIIDEPNDKVEIKLIVGGTTVSSNISSGASIAADKEFYGEVKWGFYNDQEIVLYETKNRENEIARASINNRKEWETGSISIASQEANAKPLMDMITVREQILNIESTSSGPDTNLPPDTLLVMQDTVAGVEYVTNEVATGDPSYVDTNFSPFVTGLDREDDEELRERAFETTSIGGAATVSAIEGQLWKVEGVKSVNLKRNRKETTQDGLPPHSFEPIIYGGSKEEIGETLFNTSSIDSHDVGGIHGVEETHDVQSDVTGSVETMHWSRPSEITANVEVELVVDNTYIGNEATKEKIVEQIGGTGLDGEFVTSMQGEGDIYYSIIEQYLVSPDENGIWNVNTLKLDKGSDGNDDGTTNANGAKVLEVGDGEVVTTNARDGSITITTVQK